MDQTALREYVKEKGLTYHIETYGCQMNAHDSEKIAGILEDLGFSAGKSKYEADFVIFNTCCVRENAENKIFGNVGVLKQVKRARPDMLISVCGCMMQQPGMAEKLSRMFPFVDIIFGTTNMDELPAMTAAALEKNRSVRVKEEPSFEEDLLFKRGEPPLASVNIMQGCDNFCAYCIVPYVRGRERSRSMEAVVREVETLAAEGYKEVLLLGQNVNSYGRGVEGASFPKLLERVSDTGIRRIRFMTSHPKDVSSELLRVMRERENICKHLHLPVQSGSTAILERMNRRYSRESYLRLVEQIRSVMPEIELSTDIIVGFPGETEKDFQDTLGLVEQVRFDSAFTFVYSKRSGTRAADFTDQVPEDVKQKRIVELVALQSAVTYESNRSKVGAIEEVLVEGASARNPADVCGRTDGGKMVNFPGELFLKGEIVPVEIIEAKKTTLQGRRIYV